MKDNIRLINTGKVEILLFKKPEGFKSYAGIKGDHFYYWTSTCTEKMNDYPMSIRIPELTFKSEFLGGITELNEEQCRELFKHKDGYGKSFELPEPNHRSAYFIAKEAFASLMQVNEIYSKNPYGNKAPKYDVSKSDGSATRYLEWKKAEKSTGLWLVLVKVGNE